MAGSGPVYVVNHRGQSRRLSGARCSGHKYQSAPLIGGLLNDRRQAELFYGPDGCGNYAKHDADRAALLEDIAAEAAESRYSISDVYLGVFAESLLLPVVHDRECHSDGILGR